MLLLQLRVRRKHRPNLVVTLQVDMLTAAFNSFGVVQNVKLVRDKGGNAVALCPLPESAPSCMLPC